jgi:YD repeat-containing protein
LSDYANTSDLIVRREYLATGQVAVSRYVYDAQRHLRFAISPNGDVSEYRYDSKGQRTFSISYSTQGFDASLLNNAQTPSLSDMVNWATSNIAGAKIQEFSYDFRGQVQQSWEYLSLNPDGTGDKSTAIQKTYSYDLYGNLLSEYNTQNAKSATTSYLYDGLNRVKTIVNANQQTTTFEYDDVQNVIRTTQVDGRVDTKVYSRVRRTDFLHCRRDHYLRVPLQRIGSACLLCRPNRDKALLRL